MLSSGNIPINELERELLDPTSPCYIENLLDVVTTTVADCNFPSAANSRTVQAFLARYSEVSEIIHERRIKYADFEQIKLIGQGGFGRVELARHRRTRRVYAIKMMNKQHLLEHSQSGFWEERDVMVRASSDWLVACHYAFLDKDNIYICMEYMPGGDLYYWLEKLDTFTEDQVRFYLAETTLALEALHSLGFIHRDLKPDNMLLDAKGHLKLADFGSCIQVGPDGYTMCNSPIGTPDYISPEMLNCQNVPGRIGPGCDWWSVGIVAYEMLFGETPFYGESLVETYSRILAHGESLKIPTDLDPPPSNEFVSFIISLLKPISQRLGSLDAVRAADPSISDSSTALKVATDEIKAHPFFVSVKWSQLRSQIPPIQPTVNSETDTSNVNFDGLDSPSSGSGASKLPQSKGAFDLKKPSPPAYFTGKHLSFAGFTFNRDHTYFKSVLSEKEGLRNAGTPLNGEDKSRMRLESAEAKVSELKAKIQELERQTAKDQVALKDSQRRLAECLSELDAGKASRAETENMLTDLRGRLSTSQAERDKLTSEVSRLTQKLKLLKEQEEKLIELSEEKSALCKQIESLQTKGHEYQVKLTEALKVCDSLQSSSSAGKHLKKEAQEGNSALIASLEAQLASLEREKQEARQKTMIVAEEVSNLRRNYGQQIAELTDQLQAAQDFCQVYETQAKEVKDALESSLAKVSTLSASLEEALVAKRVAESHVVELESSVAVLHVEKRSLEEMLQTANKTAKNRENELTELAERRFAVVSDMSSQLDEMRDRCTKAEESSVQLTDQVCKLQKERDLLQRNMHAVVDKLYSTVENTKLSGNAHRTTKKVDKNAYRQLESKFKNLECNSQKQIAELRSTIDQYKRDLAERNDVITSLTEASEEKESELKKNAALIAQLYARLDGALPVQSTPIKQPPAGTSPVINTGDRPSSGQPSFETSMKPSTDELPLSSTFSELGSDNIFAVVLQSPVDISVKRHGRHKLAWSPRHAVLKPFALLLFASRQEKECGAAVVEEIPLYRLVHCRDATELDLIHAKRGEISRTIQLFYQQENQDSPSMDFITESNDHQTSNTSLVMSSTMIATTHHTSSSSATSSGGSSTNANHVHWLGHTFQPIRFRRGAVLCDVCHRPCSDLISPPPALECIKCRIRVHLDHVEKRIKFSACNDATEVRYMRMPSESVKTQWRKHVTALSHYLQELQANPELLRASGLIAQATTAGGVQNIGRSAIPNAAHRASVTGKYRTSSISRLSFSR